MTLRVVFEPNASRELHEAADFYDLQHSGLGSEFLEAALRTAAERPAAYPTHLGQTRKCVIERFPYSVLYWFDDECVHVSAIAHHRRRPGYWDRHG